MGIHSTYTDDLAEAICNLIADGTPLREICRMENMPAWRTVYQWREANPEFDARFARARIMGFDAIAEEALEIANTPQEGEKREASEAWLKVTTEDMLGHRKLQIETRLKLLSKWDPKRFGDKNSTEITGAGGSALMISIATTVKPQDG